MQGGGSCGIYPPSGHWWELLPGEGKFSSTSSLPCFVHPVSSSYQEKLSGKEMQVLSLEMVMAGPKVPGRYGEASIASAAMAEPQNRRNRAPE